MNKLKSHHVSRHIVIATLGARIWLGDIGVIVACISHISNSLHVRDTWVCPTRVFEHRCTVAVTRTALTVRHTLFEVKHITCHCLAVVGDSGDRTWRYARASYAVLREIDTVPFAILHISKVREYASPYSSALALHVVKEVNITTERVKEHAPLVVNRFPRQQGMGFGVCSVGVLLVELDGISSLASCIEGSEHILRVCLGAITACGAIG